MADTKTWSPRRAAWSWKEHKYWRSNRTWLIAWYKIRRRSSRILAKWNLCFVTVIRLGLWNTLWPRGLTNDNTSDSQLWILVGSRPFLLEVFLCFLSLSGSCQDNILQTPPIQHSILQHNLLTRIAWKSAIIWAFPPVYCTFVPYM